MDPKSTSNWEIEVGSTPATFFLISIKSLTDDFASSPKLCADDTFLFPVIANMTKSVNDLNNDLAKISAWEFQWKMNFNPDLTKQAKEIIFNQKNQNTNLPMFDFQS